MRKLRPWIVRGQLSTNFREDPDETPRGTAGLLTDLKMNIVSRPDFVAYNFKYRNQPAFIKAVRQGVQGVAWTIRTKQDLKAAEALGYIPIFEQFDPEE